ncbi:MAG TPA: hypothetical protein VMT18_14315 [Planctomycetota bacterium]|nr:hypothetical protein [Planctomycetota bacterium]
MSHPNRRAALGEFLAPLLLLACAGLLAGCWKKSEMVVQEEGKAFLRVTGDVTGVELELDGSGTRRPLVPAGMDDDDLVLLQVLPGRHLVELYRGGQRLVARDLYFSLGQTVEIAAPR